MSFCLIDEYYGTGITTKQYFTNMHTPDTIIIYLDNAIKSGAKLKYLLQQKTETSIDTIVSNSQDYAGGYKLPEWHN